MANGIAGSLPGWAAPPLVIVTAAQVASPTAQMLADLNADYRLNVAPYTRYYSNGTALVAAISADGGTVSALTVGTLSVTGPATFSATDNITATGSSQATATQLTTTINDIGTISGATPSVNLGLAKPGDLQIIANATTSGVRVYAAQGSSDTINNIAGTTGANLRMGSMGIAVATAAGAIEFATMSPLKSRVVANTASASATLTANQALGAENFSVVQMTGSLAAGATLTMPTVASLVAQWPWGNLNGGQILRITNESAGAFSWTLAAAASGMTLAGTSIIAQATWRDFNLAFTQGTSCVVTSVGSGPV